MITFIQNTLQKHYKWVLTILLVVIIVAFVFTYGASSGIGTQKTQKLKYFSMDLHAPATQLALFEGANMSLYLHTRRGAMHPSELEQAALIRGLFIHIADELMIPFPQDKQLEDYIQSLPLFQDESGAFNITMYASFQDVFKKNPNLDASFGRDVIAQDYRIDQVQQLLKTPDYSMPLEVDEQLKKLNTVWSVETATIQLDGFNPPIQVTPEALEAFYASNMNRYKTAPGIRVSYMLFKGDNAENKANDFIYTLYEQGIEYQSGAFNQLAIDNGVQLIYMEPFAFDQIPQSGPIPVDILTEALKLDEKNYYTDALSTDVGTYVLFLDNILDPVQKDFASVKPQVQKDYMYAQKVKLFEEKTQQIYKEFATGTLQPEVFRAKAKSLGLTLNLHNNFTVDKTPEGLGYEAMAKIQHLEEKTISEPIKSNNNVMIAYVIQKKLRPLDEKDPQREAVQEQLYFMTSMGRLQSLMTEWIEKELQASNQ